MEPVWNSYPAWHEHVSTPPTLAQSAFAPHELGLAHSV